MDVGRLPYPLGLETRSNHPSHRNVWAPNHQTSLVDRLGEHYGFSARLRAIIKSNPHEHDNPLGDEHANNKSGRTPQRFPKDDVERATASIDPPRLDPLAQSGEDSSHYSIAKHMKNYQSIDLGGHCEQCQSVECVYEY